MTIPVRRRSAASHLPACLLLTVLWFAAGPAALVAQSDGAEPNEVPSTAESGFDARTAPDAGALEPVPQHRLKGFGSIDPAQCEEWLTYLASDELGGRDTGRPGYKLAAEFVAARFEEFGLKPVGDDGTYFQAVPFVEVGAIAGKTWLAVEIDGEEAFRVELGKGLGGDIAEDSDSKGDVVTLDLEALREADRTERAEMLGGIEDKIVFVDGDIEDRRLLFGLIRQRPSAIVTVSDDSAAVAEGRVSLDTGPRDRTRNARFRFPNRYAISSAAGEKVAELLAASQGAVVKMVVHAETEKRPVFAANVVGLLEGSDPDLASEIVGIGSHLDHVGESGGVVYNGADDDGSGTTGVLAVVKAFHDNGERPRRSILFMCFSGEEKGLIGSRHYVENPIFPNERMVAELQMDMIGRREEKRGESPDDNVNTLHLVGSKKLSDEVHEVCVSLNERHVGFVFEYDEEDVFSRSDHANFARNDIPIAFFFTGFHPQYHKPDDTVEKIDFEKLARVAQLVYAIGFEIADREERPSVDRTWADVSGR